MTVTPPTRVRPTDRHVNLTVEASPDRVVLARREFDFGNVWLLGIIAIFAPICLVPIDFQGWHLGTPLALVVTVSAVVFIVIRVLTVLLRGRTPVVITATAGGILKRVGRGVDAPVRVALRAPAVFMLTPRVGTGDRLRDAEHRPMYVQWILAIHSVPDGPLDAIFITADEYKLLSAALAQLNPAVAQLDDQFDSLMWTTDCRQCGYNLVGVRDPVCPECGTALSPGYARYLKTCAKRNLGDDAGENVEGGPREKVFIPASGPGSGAKPISG